MFSLRACDRCQTERRKTITGEDILCSMQALGFDNFMKPLQTFLLGYREVSCCRRCCCCCYCVCVSVHATPGSRAFSGRQSLMERPPSTPISLGMLQTSLPVFLTLAAVWTYWCSDYRHGLFIMNIESLSWSLEAV